ncbi:hypothetical protein HFO56_24730 [Rhizobium laguerreae]|uniref:hypothetical protein n=1 Tax=Rhizobium laguerreae TaxID=1076926 RepID=UPI001C92AA2A|nr:hypothetical protein [Rhizobium laguerreae]MBY3155536.1 hypothetical protein [Rhizobium laguerreae]
MITDKPGNFIGTVKVNDDGSYELLEDGDIVPVDLGPPPELTIEDLVEWIDAKGQGARIRWHGRYRDSAEVDIHRLARIRAILLEGK